jgi:hypothetical protein
VPKRFEQNAIDEAENGGVSAYADRKRHYRHGGKAARRICA